jgi:hypothetical protein
MRHAAASDETTSSLSSSPSRTWALTPGFDVHAADSLKELIEELALQELPLLDRKYTWTNSRDEPTPVRLDRALINLAWGAASSTRLCTR